MTPEQLDEAACKATEAPAVNPATDEKPYTVGTWSNPRADDTTFATQEEAETQARQTARYSDEVGAVWHNDETIALAVEGVLWKPES